ncbi:Short-chain dehydrogenase/reductase SDR [Metarhizium acridum CQMa 102]|uniref:Short-chain dehydrogenase/reductase SDR n=1 Tax=Metarhizium acridum (strain CQMa 102) TaxID=655827 RepID=E9E0A1_METAQ|nr:Short-chain dehydrogenase/reductase SDR [Metarhizium acridum CQMa 102]EFY90702.1 Short-chain dehydrogenase/reductase SDR [Metarhizium acridum CQMa 102]
MYGRPFQHQHATYGAHGIGLSVCVVGGNRGDPLELDFLDENSISSAARAYGNKPLDVVINVGGLPPNPKPWKDQTSSLMLERLRVMTIGPYLTMTEVLPQLELAPNPKVINIPSSFGSISKPGFLSTRLTDWDGEDDMETCIKGLMKIINSISHEDNGAFFKWDGSRIPF